MSCSGAEKPASTCSTQEVFGASPAAWGRVYANALWRGSRFGEKAKLGGSPSSPRTAGQHAPSSQISKLRDHWRVIRGRLTLACVAIDDHGSAARGHRFGAQDVIDAQPPILGKAELAVVPPSVLTRLRMKLAERVHQAPATDLGQGGPLVGMAHHPIAPSIGIVNVPVLRRDIEIAAKDQRLAGVGVSRKPVSPALQPCELVRELVRPHRLPVGHVETAHANRAHTNHEKASLRILDPIAEAPHDVGKRLARQHGHAVVGLLAVRCHPIAQ